MCFVRKQSIKCVCLLYTVNHITFHSRFISSGSSFLPLAPQAVPLQTENTHVLQFHLLDFLLGDLKSHWQYKVECLRGLCVSAGLEREFSGFVCPSPQRSDGGDEPKHTRVMVRSDLEGKAAALHAHVHVFSSPACLCSVLQRASQKFYLETIRSSRRCEADWSQWACRTGSFHLSRSRRWAGLQGTSAVLHHVGFCLLQASWTFFNLFSLRVLRSIGRRSLSVDNCYIVWSVVSIKADPMTPKTNFLSASLFTGLFYQVSVKDNSFATSMQQQQVLCYFSAFISFTAVHFLSSLKIRVNLIETRLYTAV